MANIKNLEMGVASITFNGIDIGHTLGGAKGTITRKMVAIKADKYGDTAVDQVLTEVGMKLEMKVAEPVIANIRLALPESDYQIGATGSRLGIGAGEGQSMRALAGLVVLHPIKNAASDQSEDITMYLGVSSSSPVLNYEVANQRVFDLSFEALVSEAYVPGRRLGHVGPTNIS
jgi:hypothetical protein